MVRTGVAAWAVGVLALAWTSAGMAQAPPPLAPAAALPVTTKKMPPEQAAELQGRLRLALEDLGLFQLAPAEGVQKVVDRLSQDKIYKDACLEQMSCTRKVGSKLKATWLFHLSAAQALGGVTLTVRAFDGRTGELVRKAARFAGEGPGELERALVQATRLAAGPILTASRPGQGRLVAEVEPADVEILVNGAICMKCDVPEGAEFPSGAVELVIQRVDHLPHGEVVLLQPGQLSRVKVTLELTPEARRAREAEAARKAALAKQALANAEPRPEPPPPPPPPEEAAFYETWWFWTVVGVVVAGGVGVGVYFGLQDEGPSGSGGIHVGWE